MINSQIQDGAGGAYRARVNGDEALYVTQVPYPPFIPQRTKPFRQFLTDDGTSSGSNDMGIDGSSTNVDFYVPSSATADRYISNLNILVAYGTTGEPNQWADGSALSNGMRLFYTATSGEIEIHDTLKANQDFFRLAFTLIPTAWELRHVNALNDFGYIMDIDLAKMMPPFGIKLDQGSAQRITMTVRDNAGTDADTFNVIAVGFDREE